MCAARSGMVVDHHALHASFGHECGQAVGHAHENWSRGGERYTGNGRWGEWTVLTRWRLTVVKAHDSHPHSAMTSFMVW